IADVRHNGLLIDLGGLVTFVPTREVPGGSDGALADSYSIEQAVMVTICDVRESDVVASLRLPEEPAQPLPSLTNSYLAELEARFGKGLFTAVEGELQVDL